MDDVNGAAPVSPIENVSLPILLAMQLDAAENLTTAKAKVAMVAAELSRRYTESAKNALTQAGKEHGTITLPLQDGFEVKADAKREVKWDSAKLQALAQTLPWERVSAMFKIEFSMPEAIYKGVAAFSPEMRAKIDDARTTIVKPPVCVLVQKEG